MSSGWRAKSIAIGFVLALCASWLEAQGDIQQSLQSRLPLNRGTARSETPRPQTLSIAPQDIDKLELAPGFLLSLYVLDDSDFTGTYRVDQQGRITVPILGSLPVAGKTVPGVQAEIQALLREKKLLVNPQVVLSVLEIVPPMVSILGEVNMPGKYPLLAPRTLPEVLALAGGMGALAGNRIQVTPEASSADSQVVHYEKNNLTSEASQFLVHPGDVVQVQRAGIVYVMGSVIRPGGYLMQEDGSLTLLQAVSLAYGTAGNASLKKIYLLRPGKNGAPTKLEIPYSQIVRGHSADIPLYAKDIVYVPSSAMRTVFLNSQTIMQAAVSASIYTINR